MAVTALIMLEARPLDQERGRGQHPVAGPRRLASSGSMESSTSSLAAERMVMQSDFDGFSMAFVLENSVCVRDRPAFLRLQADPRPSFKDLIVGRAISKRQCEIALNVLGPCPPDGLNQSTWNRSGNNNVAARCGRTLYAPATHRSLRLPSHLCPHSSKTMPSSATATRPH
jgi:hypothetical protein